MPYRTLADLESTLLAPVSAQESDAPHDALARCKELAAAYHTRKRQQALEDRPLRVYLLLDRWDGSPIATELSEAWPEAAAERAAVPDAFYAGREGEAPCVVPLSDIALPDGDADTLPQVRAQETLAGWLQAAGQQAYRRLVPQDACAVLISADSAARVAQHLAKLGFQYPPDNRAARVFRYQDPRVMQRVWPELSAAQQSMWLGAVQAWWTLTQPWGPWAREDLTAVEEHTVPTPAWFKAEWPTMPDGQAEVLMLNQLMDAEQWHAAHSAPVGNSVWARFAQRGISSQVQPDADTITQLLEIGREFGLTEFNLQDFLWCSWQPGSQNAPDRAIGRPIDWDEPRWRNVLERVLQGLRETPDASFAGLFEEHKHLA